MALLLFGSAICVVTLFDYTVIGESMSAGRIYDKIGDETGDRPAKMYVNFP